MPDPFDKTTDLVDLYLAECVREVTSGGPVPVWRHDLDPFRKAMGERVAFHGISLLLVNAKGGLPGWPEVLALQVRDEARQQAFWEDSHRSAISELIGSLHAAEIRSVVMKGSAIAYSAYSDPALRRRGDTDLMVEHAPRKKVRAVFRACGFAPSGDRLPLQEAWAKPGGDGFVHEVDLHWRISSSMSVAKAFERNHPRRRSVALPRLSVHAMATGPIDNFILICINRAAHGAFGYFVEERRVFCGDRLIWAVDLHRLAQQFTMRDWEEMASIAAECGAAGLVASGIEFARQTLSTQIPEQVDHWLVSANTGEEAISRYFQPRTNRSRLLEDLASSSTLADGIAVVRSHALPGREFMQRRYPGSDNWPLFALHLRRMIDAGQRMLLGGKR